MDKSLGAEVSARAQAADAMLADGVVSGEEVDTLLGHGAASGSAGSDVCLPTGVLNVDSALGGGMLGGQVLLVSKEVETGGQVCSIHCCAAHSTALFNLHSILVICMCL